MQSGFIKQSLSGLSGNGGFMNSTIHQSHDSSGLSGVSAPRWQLDSIYPGLESKEFTLDQKNLDESIETMIQLAPGPKESSLDLNTGLEWLRRVFQTGNSISDIAETLGSYLYCLYSTNTTDSKILGHLTALEGKLVRVTTAQTVFRNTLAGLEKNLGILKNLPEDLESYRLFLVESLTYQAKQMSPEQEDLAAELARSGADAWGRLQEQLSSTLGKPWNSETGEQKTLVQLRAMAFDPDRENRKKAYHLELDVWKDYRVAFAASLNGVKGTSISLDTRRGWDSTLDKTLLQNRITRKTLDALITAMEESLPAFRRYLNTKAKLLGLPVLSFYDIFAPLPEEKSTNQPAEELLNQQWTYEKAREFIVKIFTNFSQDMGNYAQMAFEKGWIDAEPRSGKVGGAYCTDMPSRKESRILANFDGSFSSVSTLAHELGHGYHTWILRNDPGLTNEYPMTLAETASIFCETLIYNGALKETQGTQKLSLLEGLLSESTQVIVDILSRFYFESKIFELRKEGELSPDEFSDLMIQAQKDTYGDSLNPEELHPYMWAVKGHYYRTDVAYYNFPYAFGQLFGLGLYSQYLDDPQGFPQVYQKVLGDTGRLDAVRVCKNGGFDIESPDFWRKGLSAIVDHIEIFCKEAE